MAAECGGAQREGCGRSLKISRKVLDAALRALEKRPHPETACGRTCEFARNELQGSAFRQ